MTFMTGAEAILQERERQRQKGYTEEHDDDHDPRNLVRAGHAFATGDATWWPWDIDSFHPRETIWNLVRAGAMYLAAEQFAERHGHDWGSYRSPRESRVEVEARLDRLFKEAAAYLTPAPEPTVKPDRETVIHMLFDQVPDDWDENDIGILADAFMDLLPGKTEREVAVLTLRSAARNMPREWAQKALNDWADLVESGEAAPYHAKGAGDE